MTVNVVLLRYPVGCVAHVRQLATSPGYTLHSAGISQYTCAELGFGPQLAVSQCRCLHCSIIKQLRRGVCPQLAVSQAAADAWAAAAKAAALEQQSEKPTVASKALENTVLPCKRRVLQPMPWSCLVRCHIMWQLSEHSACLAGPDRPVTSKVTGQAATQA